MQANHVMLFSSKGVKDSLFMPPLVIRTSYSSGARAVICELQCPRFQKGINTSRPYTQFLVQLDHCDFKSPYFH
jgi:hypothetical protein